MKSGRRSSWRQDWQTCRDCRLTFSPRMYEWHLTHQHRVLGCRMCERPILTCGIAFCGGAGRSEFCSQQCKEKAKARGICRKCLKEPDQTFLRDICGTCRRRYSEMRRAIQDIRQQLIAMRRARILPHPYRRVD